ncbi:MAG: 2'-5' RNA ligase family protein [Candidatus Zixiibacteriota bacterium]
MEPNSISEKNSGSVKSTYAVVIFLPAHLDELIYPLRQKFDPLYNKVPGHITIVFPFETPLSLNDLSTALKHELKDIRPIEIELESIGDFYPVSPTIYWKIKSCEPVQMLYHTLHSKLDLPIPFKQFTPHVTIAREISTHRVMLVKERIVPYLPSEKFIAQSIDLVVPIAYEKWVSVRTFSLSKD